MCYSVWKGQSIIPVKYCGILGYCLYLDYGTVGTSTEPLQVRESLNPANLTALLQH